MKLIQTILRACFRNGAPLLLILTPEFLLLRAEPAVIVPIPGLGGSFLSPSALNSRGEIAGFSFTSGNVAQHAFLYSGGNSIDLTTLGGSYSAGHALNDLGQVAGDSSIADDAAFHAFWYANGSMHDVGTIGGDYATAAAINNSGIVTGDGTTADGANHAFRFNGVAIFDLGTLGGTYSSAIGVNNAGQVAGSSTLPGESQTHAFLHSAAIQDLQTLGGNSSFAAALNDLGEVVGESATANGETHAFVYRNGTMNDLGTLGGTYSTAYAINNSGQVAGDSSTAGDLHTHAFLFSNGQRFDLGTLGGSDSTAYALNNLGQVVGDSANSVNFSRAYLWRDGTMIDLNTLLAPDSGWDLYSAQFINDAGQIVGYGFLNGAFEWFLLTPGVAVNRPPQANAGPDQTVECAGSFTTVHLNGSASSDPDGDSLSYEWSEAGAVLGTSAIIDAHLAFGSHTIKLVVTDTKQASGEDTVVIQVVDTTAPVILSLSVTPNQLAPANNKMVPVQISAQVVDNCDPRPVVELISITSSEPVTDQGDKTTPDWVITGQLTADLRAERSGKGNGRVYTMTVRAKDASGNSSTQTVTVTVPKGKN